MTSTRRRLHALIAMATILVTACGSDDAGESVTSASVVSGEQAVTTFEVASNLHVQGAVDYAQTPPVGGDHSQAWQNCGVYVEPVINEFAVHSLEHGAVWITFDEGLDSTQITTLAEYATNQSHVLVSPYEDLPAPIILSAWGVQQQFQSVDDPAIPAFIQQFQLGQQSPEPGAPCTRGVGEPV